MQYSTYDACTFNALYYPGFEISCADYLQENLRPPPGKEDVRFENFWEGKNYYLPGEISGPERYSVVMNWCHLRWVTTSLYVNLSRASQSIRQLVLACMEHVIGNKLY